MSGVEILSTTEVVTESVSNYTLVGLIWIGVIILGTLIGYIAEEFDGALLGFFIGVVVGMFVSGFVMIITTTPTAYTNEYKVTISDEVSLNEFMEKYEIIDQDGKIYTVRERE